MEVTPNSPNSLTLGMVIKQITVPYILNKDSSMKGKSFRHFYLREYFFLTENSKFTNFIIGGLLAGPHRSPLIQCCCFTRYSPKDHHRSRLVNLLVSKELSILISKINIFPNKKTFYMHITIIKIKNHKK